MDFILALALYLPFEGIGKCFRTVFLVLEQFVSWTLGDSKGPHFSFLSLWCVLLFLPHPGWVVRYRIGNWDYESEFIT